MRSTLFFCTFLFVQLAFSQDFIRTSSIRINSDLQYYTDFYKKIYEYNGLQSEYPCLPKSMGNFR